jgi:hypothetical protein
MKTSEQINEIAAALAKAQAGVKSALKDSFNGGFKSKYADLSAVKEAIGDTLSKNDIAVVQAHGILDTGQVVLATRLMHKSGQWIESQYLVKPTKEDPQGYASATTYARRISLSAMVGVVADEDDDGNAASGRPSQPADNSRQPDRSQAARAFVTESIKAIGSLKTETALDDWYAENAPKLARLKESYAEEAKMIAGALAEQRKTLVRVAAE